MGDDKYLNSSDVASLAVSRSPVDITISGIIVVYGADEVLTIETSENILAEVDVNINGTDYVAFISGGGGNLTVSGLNAGWYNATVYFRGDDKYLSNSNSTIFVVDKASVDMRVVDLGNSTVVVIVPVNVLGNVTVKLGGEEFNSTIVNGTAYVDVNYVVPGTHNITVVYNGDDNHAVGAVNSTVSILKLASPMTVTVAGGDIYVGDGVVVVVSVPAGATGNITLEIDGIEYCEAIDADGNATFNVLNVTYGNKTLAVDYVGDDDFVGNHTTDQFTVLKRVSSVVVDTEGICVGDVAVVNVTVPVDASGIVVVNVNGTEYSVNITDGRGTLNIAGLGYGTYNIVATYLGDDKYLSNNNATTLDVAKVKSAITVLVREGSVISSGSDVNIIVSAPVDATGSVTVNIKTGAITTPYIIYVNDGFGVLHLDNVTIGSYEVIASYNGDNKYLPSSNRTSFEVYGSGNELTVKVRDIFVKQNETIEVIFADGRHDGNVNLTVIDQYNRVLLFNASIDYVGGVSIAKITLPVLNSGIYEVRASFIEVNNSKVIAYIGHNSFEVIKLNSTVTINPIETVKVGENVTIRINISPDDATGDLIVYINGEENIVDVNNPVLVLSNLSANKYNVAVVYNGDINYNASEAVSTFIVTKNYAPMSVNASSSYVGGVEQINVTLPTGATGYVLLDVGDGHYYANITNGIAQFNITKLNEGIHNFTVTYIGDDNYFTNTSSSSFTVYYVNTSIKVEGNNITYGEDEILIIETSESLMGVIVVNINGTNYTAFVNDGKGNLIVPGLSAGLYEVNVYFEGDAKYASATNSTKFTVSKSNAAISIELENINYGEVETVTVYVNATGNVTVKLEGRVLVENSTLTDGKFTYDIPELNAGNYTIDVIFNGNDNVTENSSSLNFTVEKADPAVEINVKDIVYGDIEYIIVHVNASGTVTIKVDGREQTLSLENGYGVLKATRWEVQNYNGNATLEVHNLSCGTHSVEVTYNGNDNFNKFTNTAEFNVVKANIDIEVNVSDINVGQNEVISISLNNTNVNGDVIVNVDGTNYTVPVVNGTGNFTVPTKLKAGNHTVVVVFEENENITGTWASATFEVSKLNAPVDIKIDSTSAGENVTVTVTLPDDAAGQVLVDIEDIHYYANVTGGVASIEIPKLSDGTHDVVVTYLGDENYTSASSSTSLTLSKVESLINATPKNITAGDDEVITVTLPEDATGNVTVTVDGKDYASMVSDGRAVLVIPNIKVGNYTFDVIYNGDDKYKQGRVPVEFNVSKATSKITPIDQNNGTVIVVVPENAEGNVTVNVDGENYTAPVIDGVASVTLTNATPGKHDITVTYSGDENHTSATSYSAVTIPIYSTPMDVNVTSIKVGDSEEIIVTLPENATGEVTIEIDGIRQTKEVTDGIARFAVDNLTSGNKTVSVKYCGDDSFSSNSTTADFEVSKCDSTVNITMDNIKVGENATVTVYVPEDATGQVLLDIGDEHYYANVTDGVGTITIPRLPEGDYNITVTYTGDEKYGPNSNTAYFKVDKVDSFVNASAQDIGAGEDEVITFTVPDDATGNITVEVGGETYIVSVSGGNGVLTIPNLPRGNYTVEYRYNGDGKYAPCEGSTNFTVIKISTEMDITDQGNGTVVIDLPDDAGGNVTVVVDNETYTAPVIDGVARVTLINTTPGIHNITVIYSGDDEYHSQTKNATVVIPKDTASIQTNVSDINVGDNEIVTVTLPDDATGNVTLEVDGKTYTVPVKDGKAVFTVPGLTAGDKTIAITYGGDDRYVGNFTTAKFSVSKSQAPGNIKVSSKDITVGDDEVITVTGLPKDATGKVLVEINGVGYYSTVINGVARVVVPELRAGTYTAKVRYEGDDKYLPSDIYTTKFTATKSKTPIKADGDDIEQGQDATIVVNVPDAASGIVIIKVDGKEYKTEVVNGKAIFHIPGLGKGDHDVSAVYSGDKYYEANSTITDIIVHYDEDHNNTHHQHKYAADSYNKVSENDLSSYPTGNPIFALLIVLFALCFTQIRRFK